MLTMDPTKRIGSEEAMKDAYFREEPQPSKESASHLSTRSCISFHSSFFSVRISASLRACPFLIRRGNSWQTMRLKRNPTLWPARFLSELWAGVWWPSSETFYRMFLQTGAIQAGQTSDHNQPVIKRPKLGTNMASTTNAPVMNSTEFQVSWALHHSSNG